MSALSRLFGAKLSASKKKQQKKAKAKVPPRRHADPCHHPLTHSCQSEFDSPAGALILAARQVQILIHLPSRPVLKVI